MVCSIRIIRFEEISKKTNSIDTCETLGKDHYYQFWLKQEMSLSFAESLSFIIFSKTSSHPNRNFSKLQKSR